MTDFANFAEDVARAAYEKFNENLIGCCEPSWDDLPQSFKERLIDAQRSAISAMRLPDEAWLHPLLTGDMVDDFNFTIEVIRQGYGECVDQEKTK